MLQTERQLGDYAGLDTWTDAAILDALRRSQLNAVECIGKARDSLAQASSALADRLREAGRLVYAGAGSAIRQGIVDGAELPATFGLSVDRLRYLIAGGRNAVFDGTGASEDDVETARREAAGLNLTADDAMIALSASGSTPYTLAAAEAAKRSGVLLIAIVNNACSPLAKLADHEIFLDSGPEVIAGSTRMAAGTAQKCALNLLSTLAHIKMGGVYDGLMVNVRADNAKLRSRACGIIAKIAKVDDARALRALDASKGEVKPAVLLCAGAKDIEAARALIADSNGNLRLALKRLAAQ
jgi:N-acetylmuramic acid 6-phosphate etherase